MKTQKVIIGLLATILILTSPILSAGPVSAQNPPPPEDPSEPWNPPEEGGEVLMPSGVKSELDASYCYPPPPLGTSPSIQSAYFIDDAGRVRTEFGDEPFHLVVQVNSPGYFYLAEYYPRGSGLPPHWLIHRYNLSRAGSWTFGPFHPQPSEPVGRHTWKMWLFASGGWAQRLAHFSYKPYYPQTTYPYLSPTPIPTPAPSGWGGVQVLVVGILVGALGVSVGMLISGRRRYSG